MTMKRFSAINVLICCLIAPQAGAGDIASDLARAEVVFIGRVIRVSDIVTSILNPSGAPTSETEAVLVTLDVERVIKGAVASQVDLLFWPLLPEARMEWFPPPPFRIPAHEERLLITGIRPQAVGGAFALAVDEERFLLCPSREVVGLLDLFGPGPGGFYVLPGKFGLPDRKPTMVRDVAMILASAAMFELDGRLSWWLWSTLAELGSFTRYPQEAGYDSLGSRPDFEKWVAETLSPKVREWCLTRTPSERARAFSALVALGDLATAPDLLRELLAFDMRKEPIPQGMACYLSIERLGRSPEHWDTLLRLTMVADALPRYASLQALRELITYKLVQVELDRRLKDHFLTLLEDKDGSIRYDAVWLLTAITGDTAHTPLRYKAGPGELANECLQYWKHRIR